MRLQSGEEIIKIYHHHPFPFIIQIFKVIGASLPFFFMLYLFSQVMSYTAIIISILAIMTLFTIIIIYLALIYWLDKLVITNKRAVHIDWKVLSKRNEGEALLTDIQDVHTQEKGILSAIYLFDYGILRLETAASKATIIFTEAPNPESVKEFLTHYIENCRPDAVCNPNAIPSTVTET